MVQNIKQATLGQPIRQNISVTFNYDVYFTAGVFNFKNPLLAQVIAGDNKTQPKQVLALVDEEKFMKTIWICTDKRLLC